MGINWIAVRTDLPTVRETIIIARKTGQLVDTVIGQLVRFWIWADKETADGVLVDLSVDALVDAINLPKSFFDALEGVGWLVKKGQNLEIPNFEYWFSKGAKRRLQANNRQAKWRSRVRASVDGNVDGSALLLLSNVISKDLSLDIGFKNSLREWVEYREERKKPLTPRALNLIVKKYKDRPGEFIELSERAIANGWQGFEFAEKKNGHRPSSAAAHGSTTDSNLELCRQLEIEAEVSHD